MAVQAYSGPEGSRRLRLPDLKKIGTWRWYSCQPYAPAAIRPQPIFLALICWRLSQPQDHSAAGRMSIKNSNDTIGNRTRNLPVCSVVPQTTATPSAPFVEVDIPCYIVNISIHRPTKPKVIIFKRCSCFLHAMRRLWPFWWNVFLCNSCYLEGRKAYGGCNDFLESVSKVFSSFAKSLLSAIRQFKSLWKNDLSERNC